MVHREKTECKKFSSPHLCKALKASYLVFKQTQKDTTRQHAT